MAVGEHIVSAYNGPADLQSFDLLNHEISSKTAQEELSKDRQRLEQYYRQVRDY